MQKRKSLALVAILAILGFIISTKPALAYIDPSTGSFLLQIVLGLFFGGVIIIKMSWRRIKAFFIKTPKQDEQAQRNEE